MKQLAIEQINDSRIKKQLIEHNASKTEMAIILNNTFIYNHSIEEIITGKIDDFRTINLIFQMNAQIMKQLEMLSKRNERKTKEINRHEEIQEKQKIMEKIRLEKLKNEKIKLDMKSPAQNPKKKESQINKMFREMNEKFPNECK
jgi:hypothetical protein